MAKKRSRQAIERQRRNESVRYHVMRQWRQLNVARWLEENDSDNWWRQYQVQHLFTDGKSGPFRVRHITIEPDNPRRVEYMLEGGQDRDCGSGRFVSILEDCADGVTELWMSDTRAEIIEHKPVFDQLEAHGEGARVLINGLGIGMIVRAALMQPVEHIDVVELNQDVINLTGPLFQYEDRVTIHHADAYTAHLEGYWDIVWHDIWPDIGDENLPGMERLKRYYRKRSTWQACWQEDGCREMKRLYALTQEWSDAQRR